MAQKINNWLAYITVFLIPFYFFRFEAGPIKTNIFELFVLMTILSTCYILLSTRSKIVFGPIWPYLFLLFALLAVLISPDKIRALGIFKGWFLVPVGFYFSIINNSDFVKKGSYITLFSFLYLSLLLISAWGILQYFHLVPLLFYQAGDQNFEQYLVGPVRVFGPFESPNYLAMFIVPVLFLTLFMRVQVTGLKEKLFFSSLIIPIIALLMTRSRAGILAFCLMGIFYLISTNFNSRFIEKHRKKITKFLSVSFIVLILLSFVGFAFLAGEGVRSEIWHYAFELIRGNWYSGIGLGSFQDEIARLSVHNFSFIQYGLPYALHPHNLFLSMWLSLGALGFLVFIIILVKVYYDLFKNILWYAIFRLPIICALTAILIHGLYDTTYFKNDLSAIFWLIMALIFLLDKTGKLENADPQA